MKPDISCVYLIGIGGAGMSALARYYKHSGAFVSGYDLTPSALTRALEAEGIAIHFRDDVALIDAPIKADKDRCLVIYTPAIPQDHNELRWLREQKYEIVKRSVALGRIARGHDCIAVSGTHGKTTVSALTAHIFTASGTGCTAFFGGISKNYDSNLLLGTNEVLIAEADEFDRSFLQLYPSIALVTAADADHLDIYGSHERVREAFVRFTSQINEEGSLIIKKGVNLPLELKDGVETYVYSFDQPCDFYASHLKIREGGCFSFNLHYLGQVLPHCSLSVPGWFNVENAVGAAAMALLYGIDPQAVKRALASFSGVKRRLDVVFKGKNHCYVDDYAHHPAELRAAILSVRDMYPRRKLTGIFQPHLYTRTRDFAEEFAQSLSLLDTAVLLPVYPARETPIEGVNSQIILDRITCKEKYLLEKEQVLDFIARRQDPLLLTMGAGNIDRLVPLIGKYYEQNFGSANV